MWLSALLLLLGTVGVLVTARIALAVLLAVGPVFVVLALFPGTRGLFAGWLRGVVLTAVTPLFAVLGGVVHAGTGGAGGRGACAAPRRDRRARRDGAVHDRRGPRRADGDGAEGRGNDGWRRGRCSASRRSGAATGDAASPEPLLLPAPASAVQRRRRAPVRHAAARRSLALHAEAAAQRPACRRRAPVHARTSRTVITHMAGSAPALPPLPARRARGIGSRFAARPNLPREMIR